MSSPLEEPHVARMNKLMTRIQNENPELYNKIADVLTKGNNPKLLQQIRDVLEGTKYAKPYDTLVQNVDPFIIVPPEEENRIIENDAPGNDGEHPFFYNKRNRFLDEYIKRKKPKKKEEELFGSELDLEGGRRGKSRKNNKSKKSRKSRKSRKQRK